jgi:hypothetical protein
MESIDTYLVEFNPDEKRGVFGYALVEKPAIETDAIYLSKEEELILLKETEKGLLVTPVLIPNQKILRVDPKTGEKYNILFPKETIELAQRQFHINGNQSKSNLEHTDIKLEGVTVVESWLKEFDNDKSTNYGFDLPIGTWFVTMKVDNEEVKEKIKSGAIKGISIEGEFNINTNKMSKENEFLKSLKALFTKEEVVELAEETPAVVEETPAEVETKLASLEVGSTVPDGTFSAEDGTVFTVTDGTISEVIMPEAPEEEKVEVDMATELSKIKEELKLSFDAQIEAIKKEFHDKEVATIELKAETKAKPNFEIKEPKTFREKIFNELINK